jgi:4-diphosphocytidyl-2-C-methyl-D-erythritol kinase
MNVNSYAKVNLYLKVGKKLKSGFHNIQSVMQQVKLHDHISFENLKENKIIVDSNNKDLEGKNNLAYKAAEILKDRFNIKEGIRMNIEKNIPMAAGLGGGSSDAATALLILNKQWKIKLNQKKLVEIGVKIGSDVPFFIVGKTATVEGIGNKIKPIRKSISMNVVLVNPGTKVSTTQAYKQLDKFKAKDKNKKSITELVKAMGKKDVKKIAENIHNDFDMMMEKKYSIIKDIKTSFRKFDALNSMVAGSGPTVLGLYDSIYSAREAYFKFKDLYPFVYLTKTF